MDYCTPDELTLSLPWQTLVWLSNEDATATTVNEAVVQEAIRHANERIDAYLRGRYTLPLPEVPTVIHDVAVAITRYRLYARRPEGALPDAVKDDYKDALKQLTDIRDNRMTLALPSTEADAPESGEFKVRARRPTFGGANGLLEKY
ncbi:gp436 family protein [Escherichia coli]|uniref:gp436 family protein n=1 Tax=Escherichia coli TaxID=562 RepID=UPI000BDF1FBC|nr:DUF1320 domain-containing protein [Escherichia coli]EGH1358793.1 DUF1320 domain-containing protein [Escherichia coli]EJR8421253.1 DUF1320 domain-containing protein [Escherichia coli]MDT0829286.1 DUF1320 domain-containing protein [Escherichia coli]MDT0852872.1 DUF1320 domain-containing protein [Escherichia coli]